MVTGRKNQPQHKDLAETSVIRDLWGTVLDLDFRTDLCLQQGCGVTLHLSLSLLFLPGQQSPLCSGKPHGLLHFASPACRAAGQWPQDSVPALAELVRFKEELTFLMGSPSRLGLTEARSERGPSPHQGIGAQHRWATQAGMTWISQDLLMNKKKSVTQGGLMQQNCKLLILDFFSCISRLNPESSH